MSSAACETCHMSNYDAAIRPVHNPNYSTGCADCHTTAMWTQCIHSPTAQTKFAIIAPSKHTGIACLDCHATKISYDFKANPDCVSSNCHPQAQFAADHPGGAWKGDTDKKFCLTCHPGGTGAGHNETAFPITTGKHARNPAIGCNEGSATANGYCHNTQISSDYKKNPDCTSVCHTLNWFNNQHDNASGIAAQHDTTNHQFCRDSGCHPDGLKHGG